MRAITDIPAKTPRPIGRTDSFFPGSVKAAWEVTAPAAVAPAEAPEDAADAEVAADKADVDVAADFPVLAAEAAEPLAEELPWAVEDAMALAEPVAVAEPADATGTLDKPFTMGPDPAVAEAPAAEAVVDAALLPPPPSEVEVAPAEEEATVEVAIVVESDPAALEEPPPLSDDTVQSFTSSTCGCPSTVIGVSVILQVSVTGPLEVLICVTVVTVVGCELSAF